MRLKLGPIRNLVEGLTMNDACKITRDPELTSDDNWDEDTGQYTPPANDRNTIYEGPCTVYPRTSGNTDEESGGEELSATMYWIGIPMSAEVQTKKEDLVEITGVDPEQGDPELLDEIFVVEGQEYNTMASTRRIMAKHLAEVP